jgi:hypothetical protein
MLSSRKWRLRAATFVFGIAAAAAILGIAAPANAHNSHGWYWNHYKAEVKLQISRWGIHYGVYNATCDGIGYSIRANRGKPGRLYKHFNCIAYSDTYGQNGSFFVELHVTGAESWVPTY